GKVQVLVVNFAVHGELALLPELLRVYICGCQGYFVQILSSALVVVVVGDDVRARRGSRRPTTENGAHRITASKQEGSESRQKQRTNEESRHALYLLSRAGLEKGTFRIGATERHTA